MTKKEKETILAMENELWNHKETWKHIVNSRKIKNKPYENEQKILDRYFTQWGVANDLVHKLNIDKEITDLSNRLIFIEKDNRLISMETQYKEIYGE